jgi:myo-inositol 2-dehydrogenase/D-chiro-inositol 1-dehydrogenase
VRFGLIGCGWIVERDHVPAMLKCEQMTIVGTADLSFQRARLVGGLARLDEDACTNDYRTLVERDDVDIVSVATPPGSRLEIVRAAAANGKHVVCEKPFALTLTEADDMIKACEEANVVLAMYHNYLYYPETRLAQRLIAEGAIGDVIATEISGLGSRPWAGTEGFRPGWRQNPALAGGGVTMDIGVHAFYLTETYQPLPVEAIIARMRFMDTGADDHAYCQMSVGGGRTSLVNVAWGEGGAAYEIDGTSGHLSFVYDEVAGYFGYPVMGIKVKSVGQPTVTHHIPPGRTQFRPEIYKDLVETIVDGKGSYPSFGRDGRRTLEIALAAYKSTAEGKPVSVPIDKADPLYSEGTRRILNPGHG